MMSLPGHVFIVLMMQPAHCGVLSPFCRNLCQARNQIYKYQSHLLASIVLLLCFTFMSYG